MFMSCASLFFNQTVMPVTTWDSHTTDQIVVHGDSMYRKALADDRIPDADTLSVNYLPVAVKWSTGSEGLTRSEKSPGAIEVTNTTKPSIAMAANRVETINKNVGFYKILNYKLFCLKSLKQLTYYLIDD